MEPHWNHQIETEFLNGFLADRNPETETTLAERAAVSFQVDKSGQRFLQCLTRRVYNLFNMGRYLVSGETIGLFRQAWAFAAIYW